MDNNLSKSMIIFLINEIGLDELSIELGLKLSLRNIIFDFSFFRERYISSFLIFVYW